MTSTLGLCSFSRWPAPVKVPPVPRPATKWVTSGRSLTIAAALGGLVHPDRERSLQRAGGVLALRLRPQLHSGPGVEALDANERRIADGLKDVVRPHRQKLCQRRRTRSRPIDPTCR